MSLDEYKNDSEESFPKMKPKYNYIEKPIIFIRGKSFDNKKEINIQTPRKLKLKPLHLSKNYRNESENNKNEDENKIKGRNYNILNSKEFLSERKKILNNLQTSLQTKKNKSILYNKILDYKNNEYNTIQNNNNEELNKNKDKENINNVNNNNKDDNKNNNILNQIISNKIKKLNIIYSRNSNYKNIYTPKTNINLINKNNKNKSLSFEGFPFINESLKNNNTIDIKEKKILITGIGHKNEIKKNFFFKM